MQTSTSQLDELRRQAINHTDGATRQRLLAQIESLKHRIDLLQEVAEELITELLRAPDDDDENQA